MLGLHTLWGVDAAACPSRTIQRRTQALMIPCVAGLSRINLQGPPEPDRWPLDEELAELASRWAIDPARDLVKTA